MQLLDSYKGFEFFARSGGVVVFKENDYMGFFDTLNDAYDELFKLEKNSKPSLREMYEDFLTTILEAEKIADEYGYHGWSYFEYKTHHVFDWQGKTVSTEVVKNLCYIWIGPNGGCYKDYKKKTAVNTPFISNMKKWCWRKYFNIDL